MSDSISRYLLVFQNQKRKVEFGINENEKVTARMIQKRAVAQFNIEDANIQVWDTGFNDWIDVDDEDVVETNSKVLIQEKLEDVYEVVNISYASSNSGVESFSSNSANTTTTILQLSSSNNSSNWISAFSLPEFPKAISEKIDMGQILKEGQRSAILGSIYSSVTKFTYYPTAEQYRQIIEKLFKRFPKLSQQPNMSMDNAKTLWKNRLLYKFANTRKRDDRDMAVVVAKKFKKAGDVHTHPSTVTGVPQWGIINYKPERPASENDRSIEAHIAWMKLEKKGEKTDNRHVVALAMAATLADRRKLVLGNSSIEDIKEMYPLLFDEDEILNEFRRLQGGGNGIRSLLDVGLQTYGKSIVKLAKQRKTVNTLLTQALEIISSQREETTRKETSAIAAFISIPMLLKENIENILMLNGGQNDNGAPFILANSILLSDCNSFTILIDGIEIAHCKSLLQAFAVYLSSFYIFNLAYPSSVRKSLIFIQKVILNIQDKEKAERSVIFLLERLNQNV